MKDYANYAMPIPLKMRNIKGDRIHAVAGSPFDHQHEQIARNHEQEALLKQVQPNNVKGYHFAGLVRQAQGDYETSIGEFESALDRTPRARR